jgi:hypothetical protein
MVKVKQEKFKCLLCGNFFSTREEEWIAYNKQLSAGIHIDDIKKITCPKCNAIQIQHFNPAEKIEINTSIKEIYEKITSIFGDILGEIIAPFIVVLNRNYLNWIDSLISFIFFIISIIIVKNIIHLDSILSSVLIIIYLIINLFRKK